MVDPALSRAADVDVDACDDDDDVVVVFELDVYVYVDDVVVVVGDKTFAAPPPRVTEAGAEVPAEVPAEKERDSSLLLASCASCASFAAAAALASAHACARRANDALLGVFMLAVGVADTVSGEVEGCMCDETEAEVGEAGDEDESVDVRLCE